MKLMTHLVAGYPSIAESKKIALAMAEAGSDILEIQIPFSDPIADGPKIAKANVEALKNGITTAQALQLIDEIASETDKEIVVMTYYNIVLKYGPEHFSKYKMIIPDLPFDEDHNIETIPVVAPTTTTERLKQIPKNHFIYCMARAGTTGQKTEITAKTKEYLTRIRQNTDLPLAVGFGIRNPEQIQALTPYADIAIIGSLFIDKSPEEIKELINELKS